MDQPKSRRSSTGLNRRKFLGANAVSASALAAQPEGVKSRPALLITSALSRVAKGLAEALSQRYRIRLTERTAVEKSGSEFVTCALDRDDKTRSLVRGVKAILHVAEPLPGDDDRRQIDALTRGTHNLLWAASEEKVDRMIFLSTLDLMTPYDPAFTVSESWRPKPGCDAPVLSKHLGELVCREFARERRVRVVVLRLGQVVRSEDVKGKSPDPRWVDERDVAQAVLAALNPSQEHPASSVSHWWQVFHIGADSPGARFSVARAKRQLGYQPTFRW